MEPYRPMPRPTLEMLDRPKLRFFRMPRLISGLGRDTWRMTNRTRLTSATLPRPTISCDSSQSLRWPSSRNTCRQPRPSPRVTMPA
ncbi:hypothetical protein D9M71_589280 [compost metagenome]